jgi:hypothetical protein
MRAPTCYHTNEDEFYAGRYKMNALTVTRPPQYAVEQAALHADRIRMHVRIQSPAMTTACRQAGLPLELAEMCGGLLASVVDDLVTASKLRRSDFERAKRMERVIEATQEPALFALRIAMAASPTNGRAILRHWDQLCEHEERGMLAWLVGMRTDSAQKYSQRNAK